MDISKALDKYNIYPLLTFKFGKREYNQDIMDGKLYLNSIEYFRELEEKYNIKRGRADKEDSCFVIQKPTIMVFDGDSKEWKHLVDAEYGREELYPDHLIFCLYSLGREDIDKVYLSDNGNYVNVVYRFTDTQRRDIKEHFQDADSVLIISNGNFLININKAAQKKQSRVFAGKVLYRDNKKTNNKYNDSRRENPLSIPFYKDNFFKPQKEFRILFEPMALREGHFLDFEKVQKGMYLINREEAMNGEFVVQYAIS